MPDVSFVFTNPRHHLEMMLPVARELGKTGVTSQLVSLAELRGLDSPRASDIPSDVLLRRVIPYNFRRSPSFGSSTAHSNGKTSQLRAWLRRAAGAVLVPATARLIRDSKLIVIPNDWVFPYNGVLEALGDRVRFILMQEGIRLVTPNGDAYGTGKLAALCAWGEGSADFFVGRGVLREIIAVTGAPRLDNVEPADWKDRGAALLRDLGLHNPPLAYLSNPIEIQGYGSVADRLEVFRRFLVEGVPWLKARSMALIVKNHQHEDPAGYKQVAAMLGVSDLVHIVPEVALYAALAACAGAVVLTSTVGLESLMFDKPIAALEIPNHGFGFEYVSSGAAVGLRDGSIGTGLTELIDRADDRRVRAKSFVERHLFQRGKATRNVANVVTRLLD